MIYRGDAPHPAHKGFADAISADLLSLDRYSLPLKSLQHSIPEELLNGAFLPTYDVYIVEGTRALYGSLTARIGSDSILIYLAGDMSLYKLLSSSYEFETVVNQIISQFGMGALKVTFNRYIDGIISVSDFSYRYATEIIKNKPTSVANPYIQPGLFERLGKVSPDVRKKTAITVGSYSKYKGQDLLVDAWADVRREHPDAKLQLVGKDYPSSFEDKPGVVVHGYVEDLPEVLASSSLYVQPSRVNNFPVSVLEALRAGLPTIVTNTTGNYTVVRQLGENMVVEPSSNDISSGINRYFDLSFEERKKLSTTAQTLGDRFDSESKKQEFKSAFNDVMSEI